MALWTDWSWKPDAMTQKAILSGNAKVRRAARGVSTSTQEFTDMATKKVSKKAAKKAAAKKASAKKAPAKKAAKKLDGKALAAKRKNRDSIAQYIKDQVAAGNTDVDAILESAKAEFPGKKPTRGYVRWIAKHQMGKDLGRAKAPASKKKAPAKTSVSTTLDPKTDDTDSQPAVDPAS